MDATLFRERFHEEFVPAVSRHLKSRNLPEKALLVLDNAPSHPNESELKKRKCKHSFLICKCNIINSANGPGRYRVFKEKEQGKFVGVLLDKKEKTESGNGLVQDIKTINIKEIIYMIAEAWDEILPTALSKSWKKKKSLAEYVARRRLRCRKLC
jgi:hypothetical protein